ncbi:MAG TPA: DUF4349 domain-containing protein [Actinomycetes bacterium]
MTTTTSLPTRLISLTAAATLVGLLAGCSGGSDDSGGTAETAARDVSGASSAGDAPAASGPASDRGSTGRTDGGGNGDDRGGTDRTSARVLPVERDIVYRGQVTVRVKDVARAAERVERMTLAMDGVVFAEETSRDSYRRGVGEAHLTLRVPPTQFGATLDEIGALGRELSRSRSAQDVTTEVADTDSRVRSQERSVARIRSLLAEADTIGEVVQVEAELARRESDLESLQAQLARLEDVTALATVDVTLVARNTPVVEEQEDEELGFLAGLDGGLTALVGIVLVALTVLGALLPFAIAAAIVGVPTYALLRSRRRPQTPAPTASAGT